MISRPSIGCIRNHPTSCSRDAHTSDFHECRRRLCCSGHSLISLQLPQSPASRRRRGLQLGGALRELRCSDYLRLSFRCRLNAYDPPAGLKAVGLGLGAVDKFASCDESEAHSRLVLLGYAPHSPPPIFKTLIDFTLKHVPIMFSCGQESIGRRQNPHADRLRTVSDEFAGTELERIGASAPQKVGFQEAIAVRDVGVEALSMPISRDIRLHLSTKARLKRQSAFPTAFSRDPLPRPSRGQG